MSEARFKALQDTCQKIKHEKPMILNLTNPVTMDWVANVSLSVGAAPMMSACADEFEEILAYAKALYINMGTLDQQFMQDAIQASIIANKLGISVLLDPVGCGFTTLRTVAAKALLPYASIVRANASEMIALATLEKMSSGVESMHSVLYAQQHAKRIACLHHCTCVLTGKQDVICDGSQLQSFAFGSPLMTQITGMGCALGAVIAAFHAVTSNAFEACAQAVLLYTLIGSYLKNKKVRLGDFRARFIDQLHQPDWPALKAIFLAASMP